MKIFGKFFLKYLVVIILAFLFDLFCNKITDAVISNVIENFLFAIALICPHLIISNPRLSQFVFIIFYTLFSISICIETIYYFLFKTVFSSSAIFVFLDTNLEEAKEFLGFYFNTQIILFIAIIFVTIIITLIKLKKENFLSLGKSKWFKINILIFSITLLVFFKLSQLIIYNLPYMAARASIGYYIESKKLANYATDKYGNFNNVSRTFNIKNKEVYVIIIGESTSRSHLGIYDYCRNTTPLLHNIKNELLIYNKVISPETYTVGSLTKALTLGNYENPDAKFEGSIIQLLNQAKFKTYWVSVQQPTGKNDSQITNIGLGANNSFFLNIKNANEKTIYDEVLVDKLNKILLEDGDKKFIFLHTLGTHFNYAYRYPQKFKFFDNQIPKTKFKNQLAYNAINNYDNAVRYTDFVINNVIESVRKTKANSFVVYFSDHGEEVYDEIEFSGHFRNEDRTRNVYEIPLILWQSESYKKTKTIYPNLDSKYMIDDLFHSIADLIDVKADEVDSTRSIFSKYFKERKRIVKDTVDYDSYFK